MIQVTWTRVQGNLSREIAQQLIKEKQSCETL